MSEHDSSPNQNTASRRIAAAVGLIVLAAALAGWLLPRGPVTTAQAVVSLVVAAAVGFGAGWLMRARWAVLIAPIAFMVVFEVARMRVAGPTVDGISVSGLYGIIALVGGRGIDALLRCCHRWP